MKTRQLRVRETVTYMFRVPEADLTNAHFFTDGLFDPEAWFCAHENIGEHLIAVEDREFHLADAKD